MSITKKFLLKKWLKFAATLVVIFTFILGANAIALANPDLQIEALDEDNPDSQELPQNIFEDFLTTDLDSDAGYENALTLDEALIDKERLHLFSLAMPQLENRERDVIVYLPSDYQTGNNSYPVIYVLDAQSLFIQASFSPEDRILNESLYQFYTRDFDGEVIVVGIESDPIYVWDEYGPWVNQNMYLWMDPYEANQVEGGEGDAFLDFMEQTLKPVIDERYRTLTYRENTSIAGSKMGGLLSIYAGLTRPEVYSNVMAMSPSIWFAESGGTWLSGNHLLILIDREGVPDDVSFSLDVDPGDLVTDLVERPAILDSQGLKISFPKAYLEGRQAVVDSLTRRGYAAPIIISEVNMPTESTTPTIESPNVVLDDVVFDHLNYLPLIMKPIIPPSITSASSTTFTKSSESSFTITTKGDPIPAISIEGVLPMGLEFFLHRAGTATISGTPTETGTFTLTISAKNGADTSAIQTLILKVVASPLITSASSTTFARLNLNSFTITTTGYPVPTISCSGTPAGLSCTDFGNGTARIYGTPNTTGVYTFTITAKNSVAPEATQTIRLEVIDGCPDSESCLLTFSMNMGMVFPYSDRTRNISVYLPPNYNSGASYPVIYLMMAQYIFGDEIGAPQEPNEDWKMNEILDSHYDKTGEGVIAVGVWIDHRFPWDEYSITPNPNMDNWIKGADPLEPVGGGMLVFIKDKLKTEIDSRFNTLPDRDHTAIGGASRGALLSIYAGLLYPETFSNVMALSPAVWIAEGKYEDYVSIPELTTWRKCPDVNHCNGLEWWIKNRQAPTNVKYFLYIGGNEFTGYLYPYVQTLTNPGVRIRIQDAYLDGARMVYESLINDGVPNSMLSYIEVHSGTHEGLTWRIYVDDALDWFGY